MSGLSRGTSQLLRMSWFALIPSFGLSLLYINIHIFMHFLFPSLFCALGEEWSIANPILPEAKDTKNKALGMAEIMMVVGLNILIVMAVAAGLALIIMLFDSILGVFGFIYDWFSLGAATIGNQAVQNAQSGLNIPVVP
jgi:hypothetical protein